jgi:polyferredoxin
MMEKQVNRLDARLRLAGVLIIVGLLTQTISLLWNHPLSFVAYLVIGGLLVAIGIVIYLLTLVDLPVGRPGKGR